jgi:hypothetical protein
MAIKIATNQLKPPVIPKQKDEAAERMRLEIESKIRELQDLVRQIAGA